MEYPLYFLSEKQFEEIYLDKGKESYKAKVWRQGDYWFEAVAGVPNEYDYIILAYLLILSQQQNWASQIDISIRQILIGCGIPPGSQWYYKRVKQSLEVWERVKLHFEKDSFRYKDPQDGRLITKFKELHTGIISGWGVPEGSKKLRIFLDERFINITQSSRFYKNIVFDDLKQLRGEPTAIRLHEILLKSFEAKPSWEIGVKKLGVKLTIQDNYPSRIRNKVITALSVINDKTSRKFRVEYLDKKSGHKKPKFKFHIIRSNPKEPVPEVGMASNGVGENIFFQSQLPLEFESCDKQRQEIVDLVANFLEYIIKVDPQKAPADSKTYRDDCYDTILALNETDGQSIEHITRVLIFATQDPFWKTRFYNLCTLRDKAENGNTIFENIANAFNGIKNPSAKSKSAGNTRMAKTAAAVDGFLSN